MPRHNPQQRSTALCAWSSANAVPRHDTQRLRRRVLKCILHCSKAFSRRMTSIRKSLLSMWRRRRRQHRSWNEGGFAPGYSSNLVNSDEKAKEGRRNSSQDQKLNETGKSQIQKCTWTTLLLLSMAAVSPPERLTINGNLFGGLGNG